MTYTDPNIPPTERRVEIRERGGTTGWLIAGMIAIVAVIAVGFLMMRPTTTTDPNQIQQAQEQGRQAGLVEGASSATQAAQAAAENAARDARSTADQVRRDGEQAAANASQSAQNAADRAAASTNDQAPSPDNPPAQPPQ
jgi:uncharacterized membrane-anchored protein YhcB (DUF1043 family)